MQILEGEDGKRYDLGALEDFLAKSKELRPRCFGGFDEEDLVCQKWCAWSKKGEEEMRAYEARVKMNEQHAPLPCFIYPYQEFCQDKRGKLEEKMAIIQSELTELDKKRSRRDDFYLLAGAQPGLPRLPVGEIREIEIPLNFTRESNLQLEMKGEGGCGLPWTFRCPEAMARLWGNKDPDISLAFVRSIVPTLPQKNWSYPIKVTSQQEDKSGDLILKAVVCQKKTGELDCHKVKETNLEIVVIGKAAKVKMRADDHGPIFHDRRYE